MNEKTIHTRRTVRRSGLAAKQHSSTVYASGAGMLKSVKGEKISIAHDKTMRRKIYGFAWEERKNNVLHLDVSH